MSTKRTKKTMSTSSDLENIYNGQHKHFMYFHENAPEERHIVVVFTYDNKTNKGLYSASIWRKNKSVPELISKRYPSWDKTSHRETALSRFEKCWPLSFEIPYQECQNDFFPLLKETIRTAIRRQGVKGPRKEPGVQQPGNQMPGNQMPGNQMSETMFEGSDASASSSSSSSQFESPPQQPWRKRLRTKNDALVEVIH